MTATATLLSDYARQRGITEVLHFTTNRGLVGILSSGAVLSRDALEAADKLEPIRLLNCGSRSKDADWTGWVNLSLTQVNKSMLGTSQSWHKEDGIWWGVLAFDVSILDDDDVWFTTTNNTYPVVRRGHGIEGLTALFAPRVPWGYYGSSKTRQNKTDDMTTCEQAEVLYPGSLRLDALRHIYVAEGEHIDQIAGWVTAFPTTPVVPVTFNPGIFR